VYAVVPADVELNRGSKGVGDPPSDVSLVHHRKVAALVSEIPLDRPLGTPADLVAYSHLLDAAALETPVLPMRFGAVMADERAVVEQLLGPHEDEFRAALAELEGRAEYVIKGRYVENALFNEIVSANPDIARTRDELRDKPPETTRDARIALGEAVNAAIVALREADTKHLVDAVAPHCVAVRIGEAVQERDLAQVAVLVEGRRQGELEDALDGIAGHWRGRVNLRLLGPLAAYDFVVTQAQKEV
jgi:hypothetical protein